MINTSKSNNEQQTCFHKMETKTSIYCVKHLVNIMYISSTTLSFLYGATWQHGFLIGGVLIQFISTLPDISITIRKLSKLHSQHTAQ